ncbi:MAG: hypothetical protein ABI895_42520 [Deltaproteobacteria bacterium]
MDVPSAGYPADGASIDDGGTHVEDRSRGRVLPPRASKGAALTSPSDALTM